MPNRRELLPEQGALSKHRERRVVPAYYGSHCHRVSSLTSSTLMVHDESIEEVELIVAYSISFVNEVNEVETP